MAPVSPDNTQRWYYTYQNAVNQHVITIRGSVAAAIADADLAMAAILGSIGVELHAGSVVNVEHSAAGSNIRFPVASARIGDTFGSGAATLESDAVALGFVGRSTAGKRAKLWMFGWGGATSSYRLTSGENANVATCITDLQTLVKAPVAIDGLPIVWHLYANVKANDHYVKLAR